MARGYVIDRQAIHQYLWSISNSKNRVQIYQKELAEKYEITQASMSHVIHDLIDEGRIKKIAAKANNVGVYVIRDPGQFPHEFSPRGGACTGDRQLAPICEVCDDLADATLHVPVE